MSLVQLRASLALWRRRHTWRQRRLDIAHQRNDKALIEKWEKLRREAAAIIHRRLAQIAAKQTYSISIAGGARGIVEDAFAIARHVGGVEIYVGSDYRPGSGTTSGNVSDHAFNDAGRAARDIGRRGRDLLWGPPTPELDKAVVAIGKAFDRGYGDGRHPIIDTFYWRSYRIQIIWRTPQYGGHLGHIHVGAKRI